MGAIKWERAFPATMARRREKQQATCSVADCDQDALRSLPRRKVEKAVSELTLEEGRRAYLCREHYKKYKKATKQERTIDRLTW